MYGSTPPPGPYIAQWRWEVATEEIKDGRWLYSQATRNPCGVLYLFYFSHCIVLHFNYFISCYHILRSEQTDLPLSLLLLLLLFRNGDPGAGCPKEEKV